MENKVEQVLIENLLEWRINTPGLLKEMVNHNPKMGIFKVPMIVLQNLLAQVAQRASELNDNKLNALMCQLALYEICNPESPEFSFEITNAVINKKYLENEK